MTVQTERRPSVDPTQPPKICPECSGRGWVDNRCITPDHAYRCSYCEGKGFDTGGTECYACKGTGLIEVRMVDKNPCPICAGAGIYPVPESLRAADFAYSPGRRR